MDRRVQLAPRQELIQQFLRVPNDKISGGGGASSGRTSPSVAGSMQSDPESCFEDARYADDESDDEMMSE
ncbi:unnamed protein product [Anisakis simplex]|uniref:Uncharacterized protein n=1 Tax=Anisakis simplex TaxID=6269 RepID=A0A0M3K8X2_ANISI|nr:unnamed protein product [Anisakis simplex]